jgi:alkylhydroperoxidase family enzyme
VSSARRALGASLAECPAIAAASREALEAVMCTGTVERQTKELCAIMVAGLSFCTPLVVERRAAARRLGASTAKLNAIWNSGRSDLYTAGEKAALSAAVALTREPRALPETIGAELRRAYDSAQVVEVVAAIALFNALVRVSNALT